jgi:heme-degrading monooxygenase HmoA
MYCASFIWEPGTYNDALHRLNDIIDQVALSLPGYLGVEYWQNDDGSRRSANYYWDDLEAPRTFSTHPAQQEAKRQYAQWYKGYHIVISEVIRSYGDGHFPHITPNGRERVQA